MRKCIERIDNSITFDIIITAYWIYALHYREALSIGTFEKLDERVRSCPSDLTLSEAERFLSHYGFEHKRTNGSHRLYRHPSGIMINIQGPVIKEYQIKQMINAIESISD